MRSLNEYVIRFSELKEEKETFEFVLEDAFFKVFESSEWERGEITALVLAQKRHDGVTLDFRMEGELQVVCDRCLDVFSFHIDTKDRLFVKYGHEKEELDDNVVVVSRDDNQIDLAHYFYEYLLLALPVTKAHPEDEKGRAGCDQEMLKKLNEHKISEETENIDPRWEELKKIFDKN